MEESIKENNARVIKDALRILNEAGIPYLVGGAFAMHHYSGVWRDTHDIDVYLERKFVPSAVKALADGGFRDYGQMAAGDREWIYHAIKDGMFLDVIWGPPTGLPSVDSSYYERGSESAFFGMPVKFMPADELVWSKIFVMNRHRCDWTDLFNIVRACPPGFDWRRLERKMNEHWPLLLSFIVIFDWAFPNESECIPDYLRNDLLFRKQKTTADIDGLIRENMLDPWIYSRPIAP